MNTSLLSSFFVLSSALAAQSGPTLQVLTGSDYSMVADNGGGEVIDGKTANTVLTFPFQLVAEALPGAASRHRSELVTSSRYGRGLRIREWGSARSTSETGGALAGTLDEVEPTHLEPHSLIMAITGTTKPTGVVTIVWGAHATASNSFATTSIDLNGDLTPEFEGAPGCGETVKSFPVTATSAGYFFTIETNAGTDVEGIGAGSFGLELTVYFREGSSGVTFTPYGPQCAGALTGSTTTSGGGQQVRLAVTGAAHDALGVLVVGNTEASQSLGVCDLLVAPNVLAPFRIDGAGAGSLRLPVPGSGTFSLRTQVVTLSVASSGLKIGTTNGLKIDG